MMRPSTSSIFFEPSDRQSPVDVSSRSQSSPLKAPRTELASATLPEPAPHPLSPLIRRLLSPFWAATPWGAAAARSAPPCTSSPSPAPPHTTCGGARTGLGTSAPGAWSSAGRRSGRSGKSGAGTRPTTAAARARRRMSASASKEKEEKQKDRRSYVFDRRSLRRARARAGEGGEAEGPAVVRVLPSQLPSRGPERAGVPEGAPAVRRGVQAPPRHPGLPRGGPGGEPALVRGAQPHRRALHLLRGGRYVRPVRETT